MLLWSWLGRGVRTTQNCFTEIEGKDYRAYLFSYLFFLICILWIKIKTVQTKPVGFH